MHTFPLKVSRFLDARRQRRSALCSIMLVEVLLVAGTVPALCGCRKERPWHCEAATGTTLAWSVPSGMQPPSGGPVLSASISYVSAANLTFIAADDLGSIFVASGSLDIGSILGMYAKHSLILAPEIGAWFADGTPEGVGLFTGVRVGTVFVTHGPRDWALVLDYRWLTLHDVAGDEEARMQAVSVRYLW